jgi:dipeptidyl aminopeptidase/acylaminoacyl peptidase
MSRRLLLQSAFFLWVSLACISVIFADFPDRPAAKTIDKDIQFFDVKLTGTQPGQTMKLWLYLPPGTHKDKSLPCVFVAPAGSNLLTGMRLAEGDRVEHLPYVRAGFAVVAYELDGPMSRQANEREIIEAISKFMAVHGGVDNARTAVDYAIARAPEIDPSRLYTVGHSSAGTVALDVAAADSRIRGCCAYAPCPDLRDRINAKLIESINGSIKGFQGFIDAVSPEDHIEELKDKPVLLFTAEDDNNVPSASVQKFARHLKEENAKNIKLVVVPNGGHFDSMIKEGIPAGIDFLKADAFGAK